MIKNVLPENDTQVVGGKNVRIEYDAGANANGREVDYVDGATVSNVNQQSIRVLSSVFDESRHIQGYRFVSLELTGRWLDLKHRAGFTLHFPKNAQSREKMTAFSKTYHASFVFSWYGRVVYELQGQSVFT